MKILLIGWIGVFSIALLAACTSTPAGEPTASPNEDDADYAVYSSLHLEGSIIPPDAAALPAYAGDFTDVTTVVRVSPADDKESRAEEASGGVEAILDALQLPDSNTTSTHMIGFVGLPIFVLTDEDTLMRVHQPRDLETNTVRDELLDALAQATWRASDS